MPLYPKTGKKSKQTEKSSTILGSIREVRTQDKPLPQRVERHSGRNKESWLIEQSLTRGNCDGN